MRGTPRSAEGGCRRQIRNTQDICSSLRRHLARARHRNTRRLADALWIAGAYLHNMADLCILGDYICVAVQTTSPGHGLDALGTTPATRLGSGGTTLIAPTSAAVQVATTRSSTLLYARRAFLSIPLGSLGTVAVRGKACEGWWNHMSRLPPARRDDSLRRLTLRHHHRTMSTSWVALAVAR